MRAETSVNRSRRAAKAGRPAVSLKERMMAEPVIAFKRPPSLDPGGGVFCVKISRLSPLSPLKNTVKRISASQVTPNSAAP